MMWRNTKAQVMVELMVAMGILAVGITGMMMLLSQSIGLNREVANDFTGTYLAAEGIEVMKNLLQGNLVRQLNDPSAAWDAGFGDGVYEVDYSTKSVPAALSPISSPRKLEFDPSSKLFGYDMGIGAQQTPFTREIVIVPVGASELRVVARVTWRTRGGGTTESVLEDHFYNWIGTTPSLP